MLKKLFSVLYSFLIGQNPVAAVNFNEGAREKIMESVVLKKMYLRSGRILPHMLGLIFFLFRITWSQCHIIVLKQAQKGHNDLFSYVCM